ncbi:hypothetical protein PsorP6_000543 [Peronosclerospora sorghi]|uniref:Uncharacterized protein n=1 Tax=Peronosclerospora sorghi TaxID=230839 RepID=A0ACC0WTI8_9STRA|nr:hypothetical protein PsorP6_000543 [Peronosclerospora sorghi]
MFHGIMIRKELITHSTDIFGSVLLVDPINRAISSLCGRYSATNTIAQQRPLSSIRTKMRPIADQENLSIRNQDEHFFNYLPWLAGRFPYNTVLRTIPMTRREKKGHLCPVRFKMIFYQIRLIEDHDKT